MSLMKTVLAMTLLSSGLAQDMLRPESAGAAPLQEEMPGDVVWGVNANDDIYYRAGVAGTWRQIGGKLKQIDVSGDNVWGVNANDDIYYRNGVDGSWKHIAGKLKHVSVSGDNVWGVNAADNIYYRTGEKGTWRQIPGKLKQIEVSGDNVWGVNSNDDIYYRNGVEGTWKQIAGKLKHVSVSGDNVWGVNANDDIYYREGPNGAWRQIAGKLKQIDVVGEHVWGVNSADSIYYRNGVDGKWIHIAGKLKHATVSGVPRPRTKYFLLKTDGFNCKNQALDYITDVAECMRAGRALGVTYANRPSLETSGPKFCGTSIEMTTLTFTDPEAEGDVLHYATNKKFMICKEKKSPWEDENCGRELCIPEYFKTDDPKVFDLSMVVWEYFGGGAYNGHIPDQPFKDNVMMFKMSSSFMPYFHTHTNFHSGWILEGAKKTFNLDENENDPKHLKPIGTYFAVEEKVWHSEKLESGDTVVYLRFVDYMDVVWPDKANQKYIKTPEEAGFAPSPPPPADVCGQFQKKLKCRRHGRKLGCEWNHKAKKCELAPCRLGNNC